MDSINYFIIFISIVALAFLSIQRIRHSLQWRATVTPLASIIGSGFLIIAPLLHTVLGKWALAGIALLSILAYAIGAVIRFNIQHAETYLSTSPKDAIRLLEMASQFVLGLAFAISVAFYASLFIAFVFDRVSVDNPLLLQSATTVLLLVIMGVAWWRGSHALETIEIVAVTIKLSIIAGVLFALAYYDVISNSSWFSHDPIQELSLWDTFATLAGMLMVTQGFETARYMSTQYNKEIRIRAIRHSQWNAAFIYLSNFFRFSSY